MTVLLGASQSGISLIRDVQTGFLERVLSTPASRTSVLFGKVAADVSRLLLQAVLVAVLGVVLGVRFQVFLVATAVQGDSIVLQSVHVFS